MQAIGALIGQAKKVNPNVDPNRFREICLQLIEAAPVASRGMHSPWPTTRNRRRSSR